MRFTNILFPVDHSDRCKRAVPHVREAVRRFQANLTMLNVVEYPPIAFYGDGVYLPEDLIGDLKDNARTMLSKFAVENFPGFGVKTLVEQGDPGICIVDTASTENIDLIMMPTHGHGRFRTALLGSVTSKVLHDAACPVWTDAHTLDPQDEAHAKWAHVMCALSTSEHDSDLLNFAKGLGEACEGEVRLIHAVPAPERGIAERGIEAADIEFTEFLKESAKASIADMQNAAGTRFPVCVNAGPVSKVVAESAVRHGADLVVIGRGTIGKFAGRLRTHEYSIIRDAPCPVLSV